MLHLQSIYMLHLQHIYKEHILWFVRHILNSVDSAHEKLQIIILQSMNSRVIAIMWGTISLKICYNN